MKSFFFKKASGLNADLARHNQMQKKLELHILEGEAKVAADPTDKFAATYLRTYREILNQLMNSKAEVVAKIGRK